MEFQRAIAVEGYDWVAYFLVKYYPDRFENAFKGLSLLEKLCRESEVFDTRPSDGRGDCVCHGIAHPERDNKFADLVYGCGVPRTEYIGLLPEDFFLAGHLTLGHCAGRGSLFRIHSLSRWRVTMTSDHTLMDAEQKPVATLHRGEIDRDFPGYDITGELAGHFISAWCLHHKYEGRRETTRREPGIVFKTDGKAVVAEASGEVNRITVFTELTRRAEDSLPLIQDPG